MGQAAIDWYIVYTTSGGERLAKEDLEGFGFKVFLPMEIVTLRPARHRKDRTKRVVTRPLFPRYLFVGFHRGWHDYAGTRRSKRVQDFLRDAFGCPLQIQREVVEAIENDMTAGRYGDAAKRAATEAQRLKEQEERAERRARAAGGAKTIAVGHEFTMQNGIWRGFMATVMRVREREVQIEVKGCEGATLLLDVPLLSLEETGVLSSTVKGDSKNGALRASADPEERGS